MNKILIDIDNKNPGAIIKQIVEYLFPKCLIDAKKYTLSLSIVNKYFHKISKPPSCKIGNFCEQRLCDKHSPDYIDFKYIHFQIQDAQKNRHNYIHFNSKEMADKAEPFVDKCPDFRGRCCYGKGFKIAVTPLPSLEEVMRAAAVADWL